MRFTVVLVGDPFHRKVVADPGLPDVVAEHRVHVAWPYAESRSKQPRGLGMKPVKTGTRSAGFFCKAACTRSLEVITH